MENMELMMPKTIKEQQVIGTYFKSLDYLITLHQYKIKKTKALKSAYLSEMFPAEGECRPKRRLAGFIKDWELRKAADIAEYSKGNGYSKSDLTEVGVPIILYGSLYTKYQFLLMK